MKPDTNNGTATSGTTAPSQAQAATQQPGTAAQPAAGGTGSSPPAASQPVVVEKPAPITASAAKTAAAPVDTAGEVRQSITVALDNLTRNPSHVKSGAAADEIVKGFQKLIKATLDELTITKAAAAEPAAPKLAA